MKASTKKPPSKREIAAQAKASAKAKVRFEKVLSSKHMDEIPVAAVPVINRVTGSPQITTERIIQARIEIAECKHPSDLYSFETENRYLVLHAPGILAAVNARRAELAKD